MISKERLNTAESIVYEFGEYRLQAENLLLMKDSEVVPLAPKACEVLLALVEANGRLLTKQELLEKIWANTFVEEANLTHHISALRRTLGEDKNGRKFIETIPRRGYRFAAPVSEITNQIYDDASDNTTEITISERTTQRLTEEIEITGEHPQRYLPTKQATNRLKRSSLAIAAATCLLIAVIAGLAFYKWLPSSGANAQPLSITRVSDGKDIGASTISPDGKFISYIQNSNVSGGGTLFIKQLETDREVRLLEPDERTFGNTAFSPDGSLIYYVSYEKNAKIGALYSISILGGAPRRLFDIDAGSPGFALSPDGKQVAFYRIDSVAHTVFLITVPLDNPTRETERVLLSYPDVAPYFIDFLAWSPDNRYLALAKLPTSEMQHDAKLYQYDLQTGAVAPLSEREFADIGKMIYGPDGRELYFVAEDDNVNQKIFALDLSSRRIRRVTNDVNMYGNYGLGMTSDGKMLAADLYESKADLWSVPANGDAAQAVRIRRGESNGKRGMAALPGNSIAYISRTNGRFDVWKISADNPEQPQSLTNDAFLERDLTASRDGRFLVFTSNRAPGGRHLFRMNAADGSDLKQLTFGETIDRQPDFSPDGNWIIYASEQNGISIIKKIPAGGGAPQNLTDYFAINPVFSPDGSRIALKIMSESRSQPGKIAVIPVSGGEPEKVFPVTEFEYLSSYVVPVRWTPDGSGLLFRHETNGVGNLWRQELNGGVPQQLTNFTSDSFYSFTYSTDGSQILLARGMYQNNAVIIENFQP